MERRFKGCVTRFAPGCLPLLLGCSFGWILCRSEIGAATGGYVAFNWPGEARHYIGGSFGTTTQARRVAPELVTQPSTPGRDLIYSNPDLLGWGLNLRWTVLDQDPNRTIDGGGGILIGR